MTYKNDLFHQEKDIKLTLGRTVEAGEINRIFKELGLRLYYDVYAMDRENKGDNWQSTSYLMVSMYKEGVSVNVQDSCDELILSYPLATIDSCYINKFANLVENIKNKLKGNLFFEDSEINSKQDIINCFTKFVTDLLDNWGEEPGSKDLTIMIENNL